MKLFFVILILMLFFFRKNIESFLNELPNTVQSSIEGASENTELYFSELPYPPPRPPPSSIGRGSLCPISPLLTKNLPYCMNGFFCDNKSYSDNEGIGRCRIDKNKSNIFI